MAARGATRTLTTSPGTGRSLGHRARSAAALLVLGSIVLAGCDDDSGAGEDASVADAAAEAGEAASAEPKEGGGTSGAGGSEDSDAAEPAAPPTEPADIELDRGDRSVDEEGSTITVQGDRAAFVTPTGNIACVVNDASAACQLLDKTYSPDPAHLVASTVGDCPADVMDTMLLTDAGGAWTCPPEQLTTVAATDQGGWWADAAGAPTTGVDDTDAAVLDYGLTLQIGDTSCQSAEDGVTCRSGELGRQFFISRSAYRFGAD